MEEQRPAIRIYIVKADWQDGAWLQLPATEEKAEAVRKKLERQEGDIISPHIVAVASSFPELEEKLHGEMVFEDGNLERLNRFARRLEALDGEAEAVFRAALKVEVACSTEQLLEMLDHLDLYTLHPEIKSLEQLGRYLGREELAQLPEGLDGFVDFERIGRIWQEEHGLLTKDGFVEKQKSQSEYTAGKGAQKTERRNRGQGIFSVTLIRDSFQDRYVRFTLPLPEQELAEKKKQAGITEETPERVEVSSSIDALLEHLPPCSTLEELNQAAKVIEELEKCSGIDWKLAFAALEAELPGTMDGCCHVIRNHGAYEFLPFPFLDPESYGHYHLERAGISLPKGLASCFDHRRYGQEKMAEDGVVETFYGIVANREHPIRMDHGEPQDFKLYAPLTLSTFSGLPMHLELYRERLPFFQQTIKNEITRSMQEYGERGLAETLSNRLLSGKIASLGWGDQFSCRTLKGNGGGFHAGFWDTDRGEDLCVLTEEELGKGVGGFELKM